MADADASAEFGADKTDSDDNRHLSIAGNFDRCDARTSSVSYVSVSDFSNAC